MARRPAFPSHLETEQIPSLSGKTAFEEISRDVRERDFSLVRLNSNWRVRR